MGDSQQPGGRMEDLDSRPSKFHDLNNTLQAIVGQNGVILERLKSYESQANRIEGGIQGVNGRLDRFDHRMTEVEKNAIEVRGQLKGEITQVKSDLEKQVFALTASLEKSMESLSPVRLIVYGAVVMILSAAGNLAITYITREQNKPTVVIQQPAGATTVTPVQP